MNDRKDLNIRLAICMLMLALALAVPAGAVTHYVNPGESIQAAINASSNGDEIEVAPGTYNEAIYFNGKAVRLYSSGGKEVTTIDANGLSSSVVTCTSGEDADTILQGFTITGGNEYWGGGMYNYQSSPTVTNCTFSGNEAERGGGMSNRESSSPIVTNCTFRENTTYHGGGMGNNRSSPTVTNCTFTNNSSVHWGGGMYNDVESHSTVTNCTFSGNISDTGGGGIGNFRSSPTVTNCTFSNNNSPDGGGICNTGSSNPTVTNCILWGDIGGEIFDSGTSSTTVTYSDVEGGTGQSWFSTGCIDKDPCFVDADANDWRLLPSSPCVDTGDNNAPNLPATDLAGNPRVVDGDGDTNAVVDMGAYEFQPGPIHNITKNLWYETIQAAIDDANDGDEIQVNPGTYNESIDFKGKAVRLYSYGGPEVTTIDATGMSSSVVNCTSGEGLNTILEGFIITGGTGTPDDFGQLCGGGMRNENSSPTVTNCIFTSNSAEFGGGLFNYAGSATVSDCTFKNNTVSRWGAGLYNNDSSPTVTNCTFSGNTATEYGGGMYNGNSSNPTVSDCTFSGNSATRGGGIYNNTSSPTVTNCTFSDNPADIGGGGIYNYESSPTVKDCIFTGGSAQYGGGMCNIIDCNPAVINCTFSDNSSSMNGGGMYNNTSSPTVTNCSFSGNTATDYGGGMLNDSSSPTVTNCTFTGNYATTAGGGMYNYNNSDPTVTNCILWGNMPDEIFNDGTSSSTITYSDVEGGYAGTGNIDADPCFVDAAGGDLRLSYNSPCIDIGDNSAPGLSATDLAGNGRFFDGDGDGSTIVDIGAYEFGSIKLLAHWRLDESSGDTAYDSIGDNHGRLEPSPAVWQPAGGQIGGALEFDGLNDFVSIPNESNFDITDEITVSAWIKVNAFDRGWQAIVTKGDYAWRIQRDSQNNALEFAVSGTSPGNVLGSVDVNDGQWHHVAGVYDGTGIYLYVDGAVDNSLPASGTISTNDFPVMIGENAEQQGRFWNGLMDDVSIFSRALDGTEITNLKNSGGASFIGDPTLKALWELDESSGGTASDSTGANHGTLEPAPTPPLWQPTGGQLGGALEFDGFDDFVSIPNESRFDITYQLTVSAWIKVAAFDKDWQAIITKGDAAWRLHRLQDTNSIAFHCNNYPYWGADGSIDVDDGQWHHVAGLYDGTRAYLYVDGVLDNSEPAFGLIYKNDFPVMIGENAERPGRCWNGLIDDVRIYTCALSPSEVYLLYSNICYVDADATGNNDGSSWTDAFNYLQDALAAQATIGWEICVAEGTYKPDATSSNPSGTGDRTATFQLMNGVILKGGYAGFGQPDPNVRDCDLYETTLSGDINTPGDANDNCYHVVTSSGCDPNTVLDGFTITGGNANGPDVYDLRGGGMFNYNSSPTVNSCMFIRNTVISQMTSPVNRVGGGGMCNDSYSSPTVTNCIFAGNTISVINYGWVCGGGMYNYDYSSPTVTGCTFVENTTMGFYSHGGGMGNRDYSSPTVTNCTFTNNSSMHWGGGMYNDVGSHSIVTNCTFSGNISDTGGGGIGNWSSSPTVTNCILWGDTPNEIVDNSSTTTVTYSDVEGGWSGTGNINADPFLVDASAGNLRLRPGSPCIEAGDNSVPNLEPTDLDGHPRIIDGDCDDVDVVDMGAYEFTLAYFGDFDNNCSVNFFDFSIFGRAWMTQEGDAYYNPVCNISDPPDDYIDWRDAAVLCENWLATP